MISDRYNKIMLKYSEEYITNRVVSVKLSIPVIVVDFLYLLWRLVKFWTVSQLFLHEYWYQKSFKNISVEANEVSHSKQRYDHDKDNSHHTYFPFSFHCAYWYDSDDENKNCMGS